MLAKDKNFFSGGSNKKPSYSSFSSSSSSQTGGGKTQKYLVFKLDLKLSGRVVSFSLDHLHIKNCELR